MTDKERIIAEIERLKLCTMDEHMKFYCEEAEIEYNTLCRVVNLIKSLQEEPASEDLEEAANNAVIALVPSFGQKYSDGSYVSSCRDSFKREELIELFKAGANWQKAQDQSIIELAEDHAYFAGRTKTIDKIKEALLSEVLPCFMHGGEADEVVAKLDEVLNQKK